MHMYTMITLRSSSGSNINNITISRSTTKGSSSGVTVHPSSTYSTSMHALLAKHHKSRNLPPPPHPLFLPTTGAGAGAGAAIVFTGALAGLGVGAGAGAGAFAALGSGALGFAADAFAFSASISFFSMSSREAMRVARGAGARWATARPKKEGLVLPERPVVRVCAGMWKACAEARRKPSSTTADLIFQKLVEAGGGVGLGWGGGGVIILLRMHVYVLVYIRWADRTEGA